MLMKYNELRDYAELTTNVKGITIKDGNVDTLLRVCINRIYEEFELYAKYDYIVDMEANRIFYTLPDDFIRPVRFFDEKGNTLNYNDENNGFIFYDGGQRLEIRNKDYPLDRLFIHYIAYPEPFCDAMTVFSFKYLETFSTYLNFLLHRMVGFKDLNTLSISKNEYLYEKKRIEDNGYKTRVVSERDIRASTNGFILP